MLTLFLLVILCASLMVSSQTSLTVHVDVASSELVNNVPPTFLSVTLDANQVSANWSGLNMSEPRVISMAAALSPALLRFGGTQQDALTYELSDAVHPPLQGLNATVFNRAEFEQLMQFVRRTDLQMLFGLNSLSREFGGPWNSSNAQTLINLVSNNNDEYPIIGWELGNEPDLYSAENWVEPEQLVQDVATLRAILPSSHFLVGPDVAGPLDHDYLARYVDAIMKYQEQDTLDALTLHHYYKFGPTATVEDAVNATLLDTYIRWIEDDVFPIMVSAGYRGDLWLGEGSSFYARGAPNISDRFVAGFMWLDKLSVSALYGMKTVIRQTLHMYPGCYGLIRTETMTPNPDLFTSVLHKRLVGSGVLNVSVSTTDRMTRVYAHCTNLKYANSSPFPAFHGAITFIFMNMHKDQTVQLVFNNVQQLGDIREEYHLTSSIHSDNWEENMVSSSIDLNGATLSMLSNGDMPALFPTINSTATPLYLQPLSYGFIVFPNAQITACGYQTSQQQPIDIDIESI